MLTIHNDKMPWELKEDEAIEFSRSDGTYGLIFVCPKCKEVTTGAHILNRQTLSLTPSIVHTCGYHGFLTNGIFTDAST